MYRQHKMKQIKNIFFYQQTDGVAIGESASSTTEGIYIQAHEQTPTPMALHSQKVSQQFVDDIYSILKHCNSINFLLKLESKSVLNGC